jgi:hypothetical protein
VGEADIKVKAIKRSLAKEWLVGDKALPGFASHETTLWSRVFRSIREIPPKD